MNENNLIYILKFKGTHKVYVGQTVNGMKRCIGHIELLKSGNHQNYKLQDAYYEFGEPTFIVLHKNVERETLTILERKEITHYDSCNDGFNLTHGNGTHTVETLNKMSEKRTGQVSNFKGKRHKEESKIKISEQLKGQVFSKERCEKISKSNKGKPSHFKGKEFSQKHCENLSKAKLGKKRGQYKKKVAS